MVKGENALVAWLWERFATDTERVEIGIGDDMAAVRLGGTLVAVTADMLLDGVHFEAQEHSCELIGRKAIACSLSDCAGMACEPRVATVSVALNDAMSLDDVKRLYEGMAGVAGEFGCAIVGGDTTSWAGRLAIDVAMLAEPMSPERGPVRRSDARLGDTIFVSGPLGGSLAGKHLTFSPRLDLARRLVLEPELHAMMDISDGLAMDLSRLCEASGCGAQLSAGQLDRVISDAARTLSRSDGRSPLEHALNDGEDFELLVLGEEDLGRKLPGLQPVGQVLARSAVGSSAIVMVGPGDQRRALEPGGFEHFR
jgi:thiamine-monophosphate kinase